MKKFLLSAALVALLPAVASADNMAVNFPTLTYSSVTNNTAPRLTVDEGQFGITRSGETWVNVENSFTLAAWIKINSTGNNGFGGNALMGHQAQDHVNYNGSFFLSVPQGTGKLSIVGKENNGGRTYTEASEIDAPVDSWNFYALSYDAFMKTLTLYMDGEQIAQKEFTAYIQLFPDNPGVIFFGTCGCNAAYDEALIYTTALSEAQVKQAMENPAAVANLACRYTFDEVAAGTVGQFANSGSESVTALYREGKGTKNDSGVISCGLNHTEVAPELVAGRGDVAIKDIAADNVEEDAASVRFYNLQGMEVKADNLTPGLYIRKSNAKIQKMLVK